MLLPWHCRLEVAILLVHTIHCMVYNYQVMARLVKRQRAVYRLYGRWILGDLKLWNVSPRCVITERHPQLPTSLVNQSDRLFEFAWRDLWSPTIQMWTSAFLFWLLILRKFHSHLFFCVGRIDHIRPRWWFQILFIFTPTWGFMIQFD